MMILHVNYCETIEFVSCTRRIEGCLCYIQIYIYKNIIMLSPCVQALIFTGGSSVGRAADCRASRYLLVPGSIPGRRKFF